MPPSASSTASLPDDTWAWVGPGRVRGSNTYYSRVRFTRAHDGRTRVFEAGQAVVLASGTASPWVAQLVSLYEVGVDLADSDVARVGAPATRMMRVGLRWLYGALEPSLAASRRASPHVPCPLGGELYLSDHVERGDENSVAVIEARAFMCPTPRALARFHKALPKDYWPGDVVCLVRCFYGYGAGSPPPIRELRAGELVNFERTPSTRTDMYNAHRTRIYGRLAAGMKGVGRKRKIRRVAERETEDSESTAVEVGQAHVKSGAGTIKEETVSQSTVTDSTGSPDASNSAQRCINQPVTVLALPPAAQRNEEDRKMKSSPKLVDTEENAKELRASPLTDGLGYQFSVAQPGNSAMLIAKPEPRGL